MANPLYLPIEDNYKTNTRQQLAASAGALSLYVNAVPTATIPGGYYVPVTINPETTLEETVLVESIDTTNRILTIKSGGRAQNKGNGYTGTVQQHPVGSEVIISNPYVFYRDLVDAIASKASAANQAFSGYIIVPVYANAAARDVAIPTPSNGMEVYLTAEGKFTDYVAGAWADRASGTNPNASTTVAGKVEIPTDAEMTAGSTTGGTGATLTPTPGQIAASVQKREHSYILDSGAANALVATLVPAVAAYATGLHISVKVAAANTGAATVNVNGLGAKTIKKLISQDLEPGDLQVGQIIELAYDGTNFQLLSPPGIAADLSQYPTAGENIDGSSTPQLAFISPGTTTADAEPVQSQITQNAAADLDVYGVNWYGQVFTLDAVSNTITKVSLMMRKFGAPGGNFVVSIYATSGGLPTGAALGSVTTATAGISTTAFTWNDFTFASPITVTPGAVYALVASTISGDAANYIGWYVGNGNTYSGGTPVTSADSGVSWATATNDFAFKIWSYETQTAGRVYKTIQNSPFRGLVDGFVTNNATAGNPATFRTDGVQSGFTGLTDGASYYSSTTAGGVSTNSAGLGIGKAIGTTKIWIDKTKNWVDIAEYSDSNYSSSGSQPYQLFPRLVSGFKPSKADLRLYSSVQTGAAANTRELQFFGTYSPVNLLVGFAFKSSANGGTENAAVDASRVSSLAVTDGAPAGTSTLNNFTISNSGLSFSATYSGTSGTASMTVNARLYR